MDNDTISRKWSRLTVSNDLTNLPVILAYVHSEAEKLGFDDTAAKKIELAVEEASANVIKHAFAPGTNETFDIICFQALNGIEIRIHDNGQPFDPSQTAEYDPHADKLDEISDKGLGSFLMKEFMDQYEYLNLGPEGKETRLLKYLPSSRIDEHVSRREEEMEAPAEAVVEEPVEFSIRRMQDNEAIEVSRCIYDAYGYSYANENVYYPERVAAMNHDGKLLSAVAVTPDGEMGGHFALIFYDELPPEIGIAVTRKKFRGQKIAGRLAAFLEQEALKRKLPGMQVREVTVHPYTQKFCIKLGFDDCGFLLAHSPKTMSFKGIADTLAQRNSDIVGYKYLSDPKPRTIYPPFHHTGIISKIYDRLKVPVKIEKNVKCDSVPAESEINVQVYALRALAEITVKKLGHDFIEAIKAQLKNLRREEVRVVELYLPLSDKMLSTVVVRLEMLGFFFTGILPETASGDTMIMQYLNGVNIDYENITTVSDTAKELLAYIREQDPEAF